MHFENKKLKLVLLLIKLIKILQKHYTKIIFILSFEHIEKLVLL